MGFHRIRRIRGLAAAVLVLSAAAPQAQPQPARPSPVVIPFELATRHIIVQATVGKSRPLSFVFDTGAEPAIVRLDVAKELGLSLGGSVSARGAGPGTQAGSLVTNATWSLVGLDSVVQPVRLALPLPLLPSSMGRDIDGIVGGQFIRQFVVEIDYQERSIRLHDRQTFTYQGSGETMPLEFSADGHPVVAATVTPVGGRPIQGRFLLDTGAGSALTLYSPFVAKQQLLRGPLQTIRTIGAAGAGGKTVGRLGRVDALQIGSFRIASPIAMFSEDQAGAFANPALAGNIGAQIISRFRMFLDYGRRRLILEPAATLADPFDRAFSGLALRAEGRDYRTFRVLEVLEDSPATAADVRAGDIIAAIDDRPASSLTLSEIQELFEKAVTYTLTIRRAQDTITATLTPAKLI